MTAESELFGGPPESAEYVPCPSGASFPQIEDEPIEQTRAPDQRWYQARKSEVRAWQNDRLDKERHVICS